MRKMKDNAYDFTEKMKESDNRLDHWYGSNDKINSVLGTVISAIVLVGGIYGTYVLYGILLYAN